jgi:DNA (cytosine-5)-methyltransferase 1
MNHIGLFEGIGGFSLAARWMGWETVAWCEWDEFCQKVLKYHFPEAEQHGDITTTDFTRYAGQIDVLTGGFPCQPYSSAGKRLGKEDDRHLWPEMLRAIREIQPRWVVGENVRGLTNWNGGLVFDEVQADLENEGYEVTPYLLPACAVNAPHRRDRIWFVAFNTKQVTNGRHNGGKSNGERMGMEGNGMVSPGWEQGADDFGASNSNATNADQSPTRPPGASGGIESDRRENDSKQELWGEQAEQHIGCGELLRDVTNATETECKQPGRTWSGRERLTNLCPGQFDTNLHQAGLQRSAKFGSAEGFRQNSDKQPARRVCTNWNQFPTQSPFCSRNDGIPDRLAGITFSKHREKAIGAYGNAIVPQVAYQIFKAIQDYENLQL